ncbi:hypothetical protein CBS147332_37 [Penicillium roqueforti]|uniref:uncharacterized protein n=1 Tax=Penicillium roqueforti TaxID=5082 RepID=UPI001909B1FD|nr:uncharacterized protein LCP9604111_1994 [Penicillium roqueforti]KAF9251998.1 hypothetical protein LCP9604111_1994 [Penicillium roqueforti]KAI2733022.1 hypothetical protein CBS147332_37 [Penicillium roqueforti]KAI3121114.1 hypothetical protein CBS147331_2333 [Penicillium roqueforti]KAI3139715.1 hypothetical protein CBS147330_1565 [Penicillium roqueforti]KAI3299506.1 hypothetical protein DTO002I6_1733 [Penicillium roqueforti]
MKIYEHCIALTLSLFLATPVFGQRFINATNGINPTNGTQNGRLCTSDDIARRDVRGCTCPSTFPASPNDLVCVTPSGQCPITCNPPPPPSPVIPRAQLSQCDAGCVDANSECNGCFIWFSSLCHCLQDFQSGNQTTCIASPPIPVGPPRTNQSASWVVLSSGDLITTTDLIPGILQLSSAADVDGGFRLGQDTLNTRGIRDTGTLAINSVATRSEEQIHIQVCDHPGSAVRRILDNLPRENYNTTSSVDLSALSQPSAAMSCRVSSNAGQDINLGGDIVDWLNQYAGNTTCAQYNVGAGVVTDSNDYSWSCITTGDRAAEDLFCSD